MGNGPVIQGKHSLLEWVAPIDYGSVVFDGAGLFPVGTFYLDASAQKNNGTLINGPTWTWVPELGRWGISLAHASSQYLTTPQTDALDAIRRTVTLSIWVKWSSLEGTFTPILGKLASVSNEQRQWALFLRDDGDVLFRTTDATGMEGPTAGAGSLNSGSWRHLVGMMDRYSGVAKIYIDGAEINSASVRTANTIVTAAGLSIAHPIGLSLLRMTGLVSSPLVCHSRLSVPQIQWLANRGNNPWQPWRRRLWAVSGGAAPATATRNIILGGGVI